jgi:DNA-binding MarR family transcriptional regulator
MAAIRGATGSSARAQSGSMISDKSRPDTGATLGHTADTATVKIDRANPGLTELAACVGTSAPSASEHATALRASGLVQTVRRGRGVNHSLTPLGRSLLNGNLNAH